ncbi:MAG: hypothetical protein J0I71_06035 [Rhodanobacter sp.]|uniref:Uncharacterized protein n=2 Tax=unclassified Rhodanobacter TaxID=2621553 RepID=A0AB74USU1_9GAMM|nr:hypothetical protein [Rhodanobacter sp.]MBN8948452.1 hypothetical protein [Rhodanobacter sp.]ODT94664.1 MAG: hypothetical protein ABS82_09910 [Rhodanobacter sp. SCN 67-45]OJW33079.1 MAG: hypothetical protein BGO50_03980 [Rhodanobacter sp. 67-28]
MKFETFMLHGLFIASLVVCGLILAAMLTTTTATPPVELAHDGGIATILLAAPSSCALPPDGVVCPRVAS